MATRLIIMLFFIIPILQGCVGKIGEKEVGIAVNNITGKITTIEQVGTVFYIPLKTSFFILDKSEQTLEMIAIADRGDRPTRDDLKLKTKDGSDVNVDITLNWRIIPSMATDIVLDSGIGNSYKYKWIRDYSRAVARNTFGELTTEEFLDPSKRTEKAILTKDILNERLNPHGIQVLNVIPLDFSLYKKYQEKINERKLADQEKEKQIRKAEAARENQKRRKIEEQKAAEVEIATYKGVLDQRIVEAEGLSKKTRLDAEAYYLKTEVNANADFFVAEKKSEAILAQKKAEAEGILSLKNALDGPGSENLVKLEYVKNLKNLTIYGQPYSIENSVGKYQHDVDTLLKKQEGNLQ